MQCEMAVMDSTGDSKLIWDPESPDEVEAAEATFNKLRKKGYIAYSVKKGGDKGEIITEFDKSIEKIILSPPLRGG